MNKLEVKNLSIKFNNKYIIKDINIHVNKYELVSIIGISGTGKSTIFNAIAGILNPENGDIYLNKERINSKTGKLSYMLQKDLLLPFKTLLDNLALPLLLKGEKKEIAYKKVKDNLHIFGLNNLENMYPKSLSGGQKQRAALLRTYLFSNDMNLLDEPFSALDYITKKNIHKWYLEIKNKLKLTTLLITHDIDEALILSDRIYILKNLGSYSSIEKEYIVSKEAKNFSTPEYIKLRNEILNNLE